MRWCAAKTRLVECFNGLTFHYNLILLTMFGWGIYALVSDEAPTAVSIGTSHDLYLLWLAWHLLAPPAAWVGQLVDDRRIKWRLRWGADAALCILIGTHVVALIPEARDGAVGATYLMVILASLAISSFCLAGNDLYEVCRDLPRLRAVITKMCRR